ncbi:unnamed protein product [Polarella glacialis]|uniref:Uncharacterized protein n=1 Tax=Polarella glacialis TaxID=89957 RepID=A0A813DFY1_POLGL|nr:unnamed protein product [Polarella glacialis]
MDNFEYEHKGFSYAAARLLSEAADEAPADYEQATLVSQVFSGVFFAGLAMWLAFANGTRLSFIQQAALEKRLTVCCMMTMYIAGFSAFSNFFQLTSVDDLVLPRQTQFTLDLSRPLEWVATCPLMQLVLVLLGGSRIPEYRRVLMPMLSVGTLVCGFSSTLVEGMWQYVIYAFAFLIYGVQFYINRHQIGEHSLGEETLIAGDSEFRKASILVMGTWFPFPLWFFLSPEGLGLITNVLLIQVGWAFLNIVAKFTFIFYIQRIKDNYCNRLKVKREIYGAQAQEKAINGMSMGGMTPGEQHNKAKGELGAVVVETMTYLGMAQHTDRLLRLLQKAEITSLPQLEHFNKEKCDEKNLPFDLVSALQKRYRVWKLEMTDNAEQELEKGEQFYAGADPMKDMEAVARRLQEGVPTPPVYEQDMFQDGASIPGMFPSRPIHREDMEPRLLRMEEMMTTLLEKVEILSSGGGSRVELEQTMVRRVEQAVGQALQSAKCAQEAETEGSMRQRMEELVGSATQRLNSAAENIGRDLESKVRDYQEKMSKNNSVSAEAEGGLARRMEVALVQAADKTSQGIETMGQNLVQKTENAASNQSRKMEELERALSRKLEELNAKNSDRSERMAEVMRGSMQADLGTLMGRTDLVGEAVREAGHANKEHGADLRRVNMMILEQVNAQQERGQNQASQLMELRQAVDIGFERVTNTVQDGQRAGGDEAAAMKRQQSPGHSESYFAGGRPGFEKGPAGFGGGGGTSRQTTRQNQHGMQALGGGLGS